MLPLNLEVRVDSSGPIYIDKHAFERAMDEEAQR